MFKALFISALIISTLFASLPVQPATVTMLVFSSSQNPVWALTADQVLALTTRVSGFQLTCKPADEKLGYHGFHITLLDRNGNVKKGYVHNNSKVELFLLATLAQNEPNLVPRQVYEHVLTSIKEQDSTQTCSKQQDVIVDDTSILEQNIYIRGPDNVTGTYQ